MNLEANMRRDTTRRMLAAIIDPQMNDCRADIRLNDCDEALGRLRAVYIEPADVRWESGRLDNGTIAATFRCTYEQFWRAIAGVQ